MTQYRFIKSLEDSYSGGLYTVSSDGKYIVYACNNNMKIKIVDANHPYMTWCLDGVFPEPITALLLNPSPDEDIPALLLACGRCIQEWNLATLKPKDPIMQWICPEGHGVREVASNSSDKLIATAGADGDVRVWNRKMNQSCEYIFKGHSKAVNSVVFDPVFNMLFSCSEDGKIGFWDLKTREGTLRVTKVVVVSLIVTNGGGTLINLGKGDEDVQIWSIRNGLNITSRRIPTGDQISLVCLIDPYPHWLRMLIDRIFNHHSPHPRPICLIIVGDCSCPSLKLGIYSPERNQHLDIVVDFQEAIKGFKLLKKINGLLCVTEKHDFLFFDISTQHRRDKASLLHLTVAKRVLAYNAISDMKLTLNDRFLVVNTNGQVHVYETETMSCDVVLPPVRRDILCFDTCGRKLVTGHDDGHVKSWDIRSGELLGLDRGHYPNPVRAIAISKDKVVSCSDAQMRVWEMDTKGNLKQLDAGHARAGITSIAINRDCKLICSGASRYRLG